MSQHYGGMPSGYMNTSKYKNTGKAGQQFGGSSSFNGQAAFNAAQYGIEGLSEGLGLFNDAGFLEQKAGLKDISAKGIIEEGEQRASQIERLAYKTTGTQRAIIAKSGVTFSGSAVSVMADTQKQFRMDIYRTRLTAASQSNAMGYSAMWDRIEAGNKRTAGVAAIGQGILKMGASYAAATA